jgi:hypothetical protein
MHLLRLLLPSLLAAALLGATPSCAPVDAPVAEPSKDAVKDATPEPIVVVPTPMPQGPKSRIEAAISHVRQRDLLITNGFWTVFHGILGLGPSVTLLDPQTQRRVNALDHICSGGELRGLAFLPTRHGLDVQLGPTSVGQGHQDQFVAEMGQWGIAPERKFIVHGKEYTFLDFVRHSQMRASTTRNQELSWAICLLAQYLGTDAEWTNVYGEHLHFEDLVRYELDQPIEEAACGGTHRLFGLTWARYYHLRQGGEDTALWKEVVAKNAKYRDLAKKWRNPDGSFSTGFFKERGNSADKQLRINTTGHILEWLALALSDEEIKQPWVEEAANALALMILDLHSSGIDGGSLYHATHGLLIYYARVYDRTWLGANDPLVPLP